MGDVAPAAELLYLFQRVQLLAVVDQVSGYSARPEVSGELQGLGAERLVAKPTDQGSAFGDGTLDRKSVV